LLGVHFNPEDGGSVFLRNVGLSSVHKIAVYCFGGIVMKVCVVQIGVLMYLLYQKLGVSAIIGAACCILTMTPLQFLIGKKMSTNSKAITVSVVTYIHTK
jgi:hypothetical protein